MTEKAQDGAFLLAMPSVKAWREPTGELRFEGVASSTALDRAQERVSGRAIETMAQSGRLRLLPAHGAKLLQEIGVVEECSVGSERLVVRGTLDASSRKARQLYARCCAGTRYGLAAHWEQDEATGQAVRVIDDVLLDHVAVCDPDDAVNPDTYLSVMARAAEDVAGAADGSAGEVVDAGEAAAPEGVEGAATEPTAAGRLVAGVRHLVQLARSVWYDTAEEAPAVGSDAGASDAVEELRQLREQLAGAVAELSALAGALAEERRSGGVGGGTDLSVTGGGGAPAARGSRTETYKSSLDGQERTTGQRAQLWKGVL